MHKFCRPGLEPGSQDRMVLLIVIVISPDFVPADPGSTLRCGCTA